MQTKVFSETAMQGIPDSPDNHTTAPIPSHKLQLSSLVFSPQPIYILPKFYGQSGLRGHRLI